jgi:hypothetical protein
MLAAGGIRRRGAGWLTMAFDGAGHDNTLRRSPRSGVVGASKGAVTGVTWVEEAGGWGKQETGRNHVWLGLF